MSLTPTIANAAVFKAAAYDEDVQVLARHPQDALEAVISELPDALIKRICRANGAERIDLANRATIRFGRTPARFRGARAGLVIYPMALQAELLEALIEANPDELLAYM
ncbi:hypothetical protein [Arthrobacter rhombi]|uniref:hypothetical protein n=1 Tax=Arthrobacter rhombi TaxID=71253 RepID=UPI003FD5FE65